MKEDNLIVVTVNKAGFEYDIHSLVKAFYPECNVKVTIEEIENSSDPGFPDLNLVFEKEAVLLSLSGGEGGRASFGAKKVEIEEGMPRTEVKNRLKQLIYATLSEYTGKQLPWGTLTGIRPTKIPMAMLEEGGCDEDILAYMRETYFASEEKSRLALEIAGRERALLSNLNYKDGYSLYIGIPFCPTTCLYCSFTSYPVISWKKRIGEYLDALEKEIDFVAECYGDKRPDTIYIGGGTPTTLEAGELERLLQKIQGTLELSNLKELTVEAGRADSITMEKLKVLKKYGVSRISVNPQTMKQETLDLIGRRHTVSQVREAFGLAREAGFTNINMDLILGLPGEEAADVTNTIAEIEKLGPDSLTVHSLAIKRASKLSQWIQQNGMEALRNTDETMRIAAKGAGRMKMVPYYLYRQKNMSGNFENVGYAKEGCFGLYNILIMEEVQTIVALGAGSISKRIYSDGRIERCENVKDVGLYIDKIDEMIERKRRFFASNDQFAILESDN